MKKIFSLLTAGALIVGSLGLAGCDGGLHDSVVSPLHVEGDFATPRAAFTMVDETEQYFDFTYDADKHTAWGGSKGTVYFKVVRDADGWAQDWGWEEDTLKVLTINDEDYLKTEPRTAKNQNPGNLVLKDLEDGQTYRINVKYDAPAREVSILVTGNVTDWPALRVVTEEGDSYSMTRNGSTYEYVFTPTEDGSFDFYVTNGFLYWGDDGDMDTVEPTSLATVTYEKNVEYVITADASKLLTDQTIAISSGVHDTSILGKTGFAGSIPGFDWNGTIHLSDYKVNNTTYEYPFTAKADSYKFAIQKTPGVWDGCYGGRKHDDDGDQIEIKPTDSAATKMVERNGEGGHNTSETNMLIGGLSYGSEYKLVITIDGSDVYAQVVLTKEVVAKYSFEGLTLKGGWEGWWANTKVLTSDATQTFVTSVGEHDASGNEWGIFPDGAGNNWYVENLVLGTRTEMTYTPSNGANSTIAGSWEAGAIYTIKVELTDDSVTAPKAFVTITKNE